MKTTALSAGRLAEIVSGFASTRIAVLGDFFLDKYFEVDPALGEISVETGKPAHQVVATRRYAGAAGTVVNNLSALGSGRLLAIGYTGDDGDGFELRRCLAAAGCETAHLQTVPARVTPVYLKPQDATDPTLAGEHSRYDIKNHTPTPVAVEDRILASLDEALGEVQAIVVMDQVAEPGCGTVTARVREALAERARTNPDKVFWADSRRFIRDFRKVIIKPNPFELLGIDHPPPGSTVDAGALLKAAQSARTRNGAPVVVTRGAWGMLVSDPEWTAIPAVPVSDPIDPTGAGDSATAGAVSALCAGASLPEAAVVAVLAASITIRQIGVTGTVRPDQLESARRQWEQAGQPHFYT